MFNVYSVFYDMNYETNTNKKSIYTNKCSFIHTFCDQVSTNVIPQENQVMKFVCIIVRGYVNLPEYKVIKMCIDNMIKKNAPVCIYLKEINLFH